MKILITGASGFLGRPLIAELARGGHTGWAVSRREMTDLPAGWEWRARDSVLAGGEHFKAPEAVIHLEVKQHVTNPTARDIAEFTSVNIDGTQAWLNWSAAHRVPRFVFVSSIKAVVPAASGPTDESASGPYPSPYGASKWTAEERVRGWATHTGMRAVIARPAVIYGPGNVGNIGAMVQAIRRGRFFLIGANANVKSLVALRNVTNALAYLACEYAVESGETAVFNLTDREACSVREIDALIRRQLGLGGNSRSLPPALAGLIAKVGDLLQRITRRTLPLNSQRLAALLETTHFTPARLLATGWKPPQTTTDGLAEMIAALPSSTPPR